MSTSERQYRRKDSEDHRPVALTMSGGVPAIRSSVVPPMRKQCPVVLGYPSRCQMALQRWRKEDLDKEMRELPVPEVNEKIWVLVGMLLTRR